MKFHLFTMCWGDHYVNLFRRACFKSLNWPLNAQAIKGRDWFVYTKKEHFDQFKEIFKDSPYRLLLQEITDSMRVAGCGMVKTSQCDDGVVLLNGLRDQIAYSIQNQSRMLLCPPDTIFGDGTVNNLLLCGSADYSCVSVCHSRCLPSLVDEIEVLSATRGALTNAQLVTQAFNHPHDSWKYADIKHEKNNSFIGGIAWEKLSTGLYKVIHRLPTVYLAHFMPCDFDFFWSQVSFGGWDHRWPAENLIRQGRQRMVGSSDACMMVEVTDWDKNVPPELPPNQNKPDPNTYWNNHYHNNINGQSVVIWRGE